jgi:hypothetical protein
VRSTLSDRSLQYAMEDEDFTVDQSLMGELAADRTYKQAISCYTDGLSGTSTSAQDSASEDEDGSSDASEFPSTGSVSIQQREHLSYAYLVRFTQNCAGGCCKCCCPSSGTLVLTRYSM